MRSLVLERDSWEESLQLQLDDKKAHAVLVRIVKEVRRDPESGRGRPERLKGNLSGYWSRRIDKKNRVIYRYDDEYVYLYSIRGHYDDS